MANQSIKLNVIPDGIKPIAKVSQYDVGREITFYLYQGSDAYTPPSGSTVEVRGRKADGHIFVYSTSSGYVSMSGSTITLRTSMQMTAYAGDAICQFRITRSGAILATLNFTMTVQLDPAANGDPSGSEFPAIIAEATEQMNAAAASARSASSSASSAASYASSASGYASSASSSANAARASENAANTYANAARASATEAATWAGNPPYIGQNGNWWIYNTTSGSFVDSGVDASITVQIADITMLDPDDTPTVTNSGTSTDPVFHLGIPRGKGISGIAKTGTSGLVDTYRITYSDGATYDFTVTNGKTAYQSAVDGGYEKTESEFNDELANFSDYAEQSANNAHIAVSSAADATDAKDLAQAAQAVAEAAKDDAETAEASAQAVKTYVEGRATDIDNAVIRANSISQDMEDKRDADYYRGSAATVTVGTVQTVPSTQPATVINTGTTSAAVFDFQIPKGERGDAGDIMEGATADADGLSGAVPKPLAGQQDHVLCGDGTWRDKNAFFKDESGFISYNTLD